MGALATTGKRYSFGNIVLAVTALGVFAWLFASAYGMPKVVHASAPITTVSSGVYGVYHYQISSVQGQKVESIQFAPAVASDDATVVNSLRYVMQVVYADATDDQVQPVVENIGEIPYLTFTSSGHKTFFKLFNNASGELGSAQFWRQNVAR